VCDRGMYFQFNLRSKKARFLTAHDVAHLRKNKALHVAAQLTAARSAQRQIGTRIESASEDNAFRMHRANRGIPMNANCIERTTGARNYAMQHVGLTKIEAATKANES
jgi:hypothetical protein